MNELACPCCCTVMRKCGEFNSYTHLDCPRCGFEHFLGEEEHTITPALYEQDADYNADLAVAANHRALLQWAHRRAIAYLSRELPGQRVLDVGCFNGFFVKELLSRGFRAKGIDFNRFAIEFGQKRYGLTDQISCQTLGDLKAAGETFGAITMFEVIEHLEDFTAVVKDACQLLRPGGVLILSTPNSNMVWRPTLDFPPHHLSRFTPKALNSFVETLGLIRREHHEQTSSFDLMRNFIGSHMRSKEKQGSMRGGEFKAPQLTNLLRRTANKSKRVVASGLWPLDSALHAVGVRYISQVIVAGTAPDHAH